MSDDTRQFTCEHCGGTFDCGWSEEEADAEYRAAFPTAAERNDDRGVVCDDCYQMMTKASPPRSWDEAQAELTRILTTQRALMVEKYGEDVVAACEKAALDLVLYGNATIREPKGILNAHNLN